MQEFVGNLPNSRKGKAVNPGPTPRSKVCALSCEVISTLLSSGTAFAGEKLILAGQRVERQMIQETNV